MGLTPLPVFSKLEQWISKYEHVLPDAVAEDETFWEEIRKGYQINPDFINLENGYYCFLPQETLEKFFNHVREINFQASYYMRTKRFDDKKIMAAKLARLAGCSDEELIITRNTTESLDTVIAGTTWQPGDEAVMAEQDYGAMLDMFGMMAKRYGVVNRVISVPNHPVSDEEIVEIYAGAITSKTKLLMVCHLINITGQILPIKKICDMAHSKGVKVLVDGAHAFAHIRFSIPELGCDYYGTSLHKWLSVPIGAGFLYVKKENIPGIWPLLAPEDSINENDIYRLNHTGTHPVYTDLTISDAIDFYLKIGPERKEARLRYLQRYWSDRVRNLPNVIMNTPEDPNRSCGIANIGIRGMKPSELADRLFKKYKIYTVAIERGIVQGCRITPNIYTTPKELDKFVSAIKELAS